MGAALVWTRYLYLLLGPSVYSVSTIWAAFLMGLGIGGYFGSAIARSSATPGRDLGLCQNLADSRLRLGRIRAHEVTTVLAD
jgi:hypothetical protein